MRDAFGGTFMIQIFIVFLLIYISFTALALNYAKAFKAKNFIIDYLEENEIMDLTGTAAEYEEMDRIFEQELLTGLNYQASDIPCNESSNSSTYKCGKIGYTIEKTGDSSSTGGVYYTVSTYVGWDLGFLSPILRIGGNNSNSSDIPGYWKISGQTRVIYKEN